MTSKHAARKNWHWDIRLPYPKIQEILKREDDPRFPGIAGTLLARVKDPKQVFELISPAAFCRRWRSIEREIESDEWTRERAAFWKVTYIRLSKELQAKGEKIRLPEVIELDDFTREIIAKIRDLREKALMSQSELAHFMGCSQQFISGIEKGREKVSLEFLKKLSQVTRQSIELDILPEKSSVEQQNFLRAAEEEQAPSGSKKKKKEIK